MAGTEGVLGRVSYIMQLDLNLPRFLTPPLLSRRLLTQFFLLTELGTGKKHE